MPAAPSPARRFPFFCHFWSIFVFQCQVSVGRAELLKGMPLKSLTCDFKAERDAALFRKRHFFVQMASDEASRGFPPGKSGPASWDIGAYPRWDDTSLRPFF
jgi:hypothetical protein